MFLINGDSWTGGRFKPPEKYWTDFLKEKISNDVINLGLGASSNQRIYRTTLNFLYCTNIPIEQLIIGWTCVERDELPSQANDLNKDYFQITSQGVYGHASTDVLKNIHEIYYSWCFDQHKNTKEFLLNALAIQDICFHRKIRLLNFFSFQNVFDLCTTEELKTLKSKLDMNLWITKSMRDSTNDFPRLPSGHTDIEGNKFWAEVIFSYLRKSRIDTRSFTKYN